MFGAGASSSSEETSIDDTSLSAGKELDEVAVHFLLLAIKSILVFFISDGLMISLCRFFRPARPATRGGRESSSKKFKEVSDEGNQHLCTQEFLELAKFAQLKFSKMNKCGQVTAASLSSATRNLQQQCHRQTDQNLLPPARRRNLVPNQLN